MTIERFCNYAGVVEQALAYYEKNPQKFTFEPRRGEIDVDMVFTRDDIDQLTVVSIFQDWTVASHGTGAVHFLLCAEEIIDLAKESADLERLALYREIERTVQADQMNTFYPIDAYNDAMAMKIKGVPGWASFYDSLHGNPHSLAPEQWLAGMISHGIEHARLNYEGWLHPSREASEFIALMTEMVVWMASPDFDLKWLSTGDQREILRQTRELIEGGECVTKERGESIHAELLKHLPEQHPFWMRWRAFGRGNGWWE